MRVVLKVSKVFHGQRSEASSALGKDEVDFCRQLWGSAKGGYVKIGQASPLSGLVADDVIGGVMRGIEHMGRVRGPGRGDASEQRGTKSRRYKDEPTL